MASRRRTPVAYVYDPSADRWTGVQGLARQGFQLVALPDGGALAIGGNDGGDFQGNTSAGTAQVHRFIPSRGLWTEQAPMITPRSEAQVVVLSDGRVLVAGGEAGDVDEGRALASTEIYDPTRNAWSRGPDLLEPRYGGLAVSLSDDSVLILGGANDFNTEGETPWCPTPLRTTERLDLQP